MKGWVKRLKAGVLGIELLIVAVILVAGFLVWRSVAPDNHALPCPFRVKDRSDQVMHISSPTTENDKACIFLERADSEEERVRGLSGRTAMRRSSGLLFIFPEAGKQCMWMKDMQFNIDIIWLNERKEIVDIKRDIAPETYPESFCSKTPAKYVIEFNAGIAAEASLYEGQHIDF